MSHAFVIMQIGNEELDQVYAKAIVPAIKECGLDARRVDKHNEGGLLKSEIVQFIEGSSILVADLTNERPNCYLEVGYAMGINKFRSLILTVREDHFPESPNYARGGPKLHFDLAGYDVLAWSAEDLPAFKDALQKRIRRRQLVLTESRTGAVATWDQEWIERQRAKALAGLHGMERTAHMEVRFALKQPKPAFSQVQLKSAARTAPINTFGWPFALYMTRDEYSPKPRSDGIYAEIALEDRSSYDYWAIRRNGDFYTLVSLFEDTRQDNQIFFNTRIARVTEALLYGVRLYSALEVDAAAKLEIVVRHSGLTGRVLTGSRARQLRPPRGPVTEDQMEQAVSTVLGEIEGDLVSLVKQLLSPLFVLFDFFELGDSVYEDVVNKFVRGEVS